MLSLNSNMNSLQRLIYNISHKEVSEVEAEAKIEQLIAEGYQRGLLTAIRTPYRDSDGLCHECGKFLFPDYDTSKLNGITVHMGTCPHCHRKDVGIVPINDWLYASNIGGAWD